jgi:hypothetical protein
MGLEDTEGRKFTARLRDGEVIALTHFDSSSGEEPFRLERTGYLVAVCPGAAPASDTPVAMCRALVCGGDKSCPPAHGLKIGTCINGLCIEPSKTISPKDAIMLCLAGTGAGNSSPAQIERFALGLNCGQPCKVPTPCRQP